MSMPNSSIYKCEESSIMVNGRALIFRKQLDHFGSSKKQTNLLFYMYKKQFHLSQKGDKKGENSRGILCPHVPQPNALRKLYII